MLQHYVGSMPPLTELFLMTLIKKIKSVFNGIGITLAYSHCLNKIHFGFDSCFLFQPFNLYSAFYIDCCVDGAILGLTLACGTKKTKLYKMC